jgi:ubiquinone/menaquinone biosynthesis C-methylase UbiE
VSKALGRLANVAFEALYGPLVPVYDLVSRLGFAGEWARWQRTVLRFVTTGPALEIGPGTGDLLPVLAEHGLEPRGLESSPRMVARARRKLRARGLTIPPLVRGRAEAIPFAAGSFGAVVATFPSAWVFRPATWEEIARVLRPGGDVAIVLGGELAPHGPGRRLRAAAYRLLYGRQVEHLPAPPATALGLRWEVVETSHGRAILLVGRKPS